jgi:hypothetical protein
LKNKKAPAWFLEGTGDLEGGVCWFAVSNWYEVDRLELASLRAFCFGTMLSIDWLNLLMICLGTDVITVTIQDE